MSTMQRRPSSFVYVAAKSAGGRSFGVRQARDRRQLNDQLRRERLVPLKAWELPEWAAVSAGSKLKLKDQAELNTQLAQLLSRGVPLVEALEVVASAISPAHRPIVQRMRDLVSGGTSFADACAAMGAFDKITIAVYRAAERTGDLAGAAKQLAMTMRRQLAISGKAVTLMIYPAIVLSISIVMSILMITFIVPRIGTAMKGTGKPLPLVTELMMNTGLWMQSNWIWVLLGVLIVFTGMVFIRKAIFDLVGRFSRTMPVMRDLVLAQESARFFTVMAAMTRCGIPLSDALGTATGAISHPELRRQLQSLQARLIEGGVLRTLIDSVTMLPVPTRRLLIAAERAGDLVPALDTLAGDMADEVDRKSSRLLAALEPALIVFMFLIIGSILLSIMLPLIKLTTSGI
jgi:type II secretory pathway component PulF